LTLFACVNAFFSLLEHRLVLVLPFIDFDPADGALTAFIGARWGDKFRRVFDVASDSTAHAIYDRLHRIAEAYRNSVPSMRRRRS